MNSHCMMVIIEFSGMFWLRVHVALLAANASKSLIYAATTGIAAALCLMISILNIDKWRVR